MPSTLPITYKYLSAPSLKNALRNWGTDFSTNPLLTIAGTPKILHNLTLNFIINPFTHSPYVSPVLDRLGSVSQVEKNRDWFSNYYLFGGWINLCKKLLPSPQFPLLFNHQFGNHVWGAVVGALVQGYDVCPAQQKISRFPIFAATIGALNGFMCCALQAACITLFNSFLPPNPAYALGMACNWAFSSLIMCQVEQWGVKFRERFEPRHATPTKEKPQHSCCAPATDDPDNQELHDPPQIVRKNWTEVVSGTSHNAVPCQGFN